MSITLEQRIKLLEIELREERAFTKKLIKRYKKLESKVERMEAEKKVVSDIYSRKPKRLTR